MLCHRSETCQYYAFFFGVATKRSHPELWRTLETEFGPDRTAKGLHPEIHPANAFIGNYLRIELLARAGRAAQILDETRSFFGYMAERTGTLWENVDAAASCNHGFASHIAHVLYRDVLGVTLDHEEKTITVKATDVKLEFCVGALPAGSGLVKVAWKTVAGKRQRTVVAPAGWKVVEAQ